MKAPKPKYVATISIETEAPVTKKALAAHLKESVGFGVFYDKVGEPLKVTKVRVRTVDFD